MNIAFIHYHLMRGGVTTVIRQQVETLREAGWNAMVLCGGPIREDFPSTVIPLPELGYDAWQTSTYSPEKTAKKIMQHIRGHWSSGADVIHVHNPTLAKNRHLQQTLEILQQSGTPLLCQIHDFAEDGRPGAYDDAPYTRDCHYAAINQRDHQLLLTAGLRKEGCHLLPNMIAEEPLDTRESEAQDYVLYPVRAIRRKNIGEALLISHFFEEGLSLAITLPPTSPADLPSYACWRSFAERRNLPVRFEAGIDTDFSSLLRNCRYVLTTSVTEGFGFAFVEPWMAGKALWGRRLPEICKGFADDGLDLTHLYDTLTIDLSWLDAPALERRWKHVYAGAAERFNVPMQSPDVDRAWRDVSKGEQIDFGLLGESFQQQVIDRIIYDSEAAARLKAMNPWFSPPQPHASVAKVVAHNSGVIKNAYGVHQYGQRLKEAYRTVVGTEVRHAIDKGPVSAFFLSPSHFSLLKWEAFDG